MSNNLDNWDDDDFDFDFDEDETTQVPANNSNDLVKKLRKSDRAKEKQIKELTAKLSELQSAQRDTVVKSFLTEQGLNPKVAKFIPADIEPSAEALSQWVGEYGDVFGLQVAHKDATQTNPDLATLRQIDAVTQGAVTPDKIENMLLRLDQAGSADDIINMINGDY